VNREAGEIGEHLFLVLVVVALCAVAVWYWRRPGPPRWTEEMNREFKSCVKEHLLSPMHVAEHVVAPTMALYEQIKDVVDGKCREKFPLAPKFATPLSVLTPAEWEKMAAEAHRQPIASPQPQLLEWDELVKRARADEIRTGGNQ
jgi:hypothetical protein